MQRSVVAETLDGLAEDDPAAQRSRRDLQRIHTLMRTRAMLVDALRRLPQHVTRRRPLRVLELGAGDGTLLVGVARALAPDWPDVTLTLLDRQALVGHATRAAYRALGWRAALLQADVTDWAGDAAAPHADVIVANLFLHHFDAPALRALMAAIAARCEAFVACEPRRGRLALAASHLVGAVGANAVTRNDAVLSVHAGFCGSELGALWPRAGGGWQLDEGAAGLFSHRFSAVQAAAA